MPAMLDTSAHGVYIIAATPFTDDGAVDTASVDRLMDFYVGTGITGVTVLGIMGEAPKLTHAESVALTRQVVRRVNGLPVVVGASAPGFASMGALAKDAMDAGAGGVMIAPPSGRNRVPKRRQSPAGRSRAAPLAASARPIPHGSASAPRP